MDRKLCSMMAGVTGAGALTLVHQVARSMTPHAPRMDVLGMRAVARGAHRLGKQPPTGRALYRATLAGDLLSNAAYYSAVALGGQYAVQAGAALGLAAGFGALALPPVIGLGRPPHVHAWSNRLMTVAWYMMGGLVAGASYKAIQRQRGRGHA